MYYNMKDLRKDPLLARVGMAWTSEEESELIKEIKTRKITEIAEKHKRTVGGIQARLAVVGYDLYKNHGMSIAEVSNIVKIEEDVLREKIQRRENKLAKRKGTGSLVAGVSPVHRQKPKIYTICSGIADESFDPKKLCAEITIGSKGFKIVESFKPQISVFYDCIKLIGEMSYIEYNQLYSITFQYYNRNKPPQLQYQHRL